MTEAAAGGSAAAGSGTGPKPQSRALSVGGDRAGLALGGDGRAALALGDPAEGGERLADHLVHVVVAVGRKPSHEMDVGRLQGQRLVLLVERLVLRARHRIVGVAVGARELV